MLPDGAMKYLVLFSPRGNIHVTGKRIGFYMTNSDNDQPTVKTGHATSFDDVRMQLSRMHVSEKNSLRRLFRDIAVLVTGALGVERFSVWMLANEKKSIRCFHLYQLSSQDVYEGAVLHAQDFPGYFRAIDTCRFIAINEAQHDPLTEELRKSYLEPLGITSLLDAPLYRGGVVVGVVCTEHNGPPRTWSREEKDFVISVADIASRLFEESARNQAETTLDAYQSHLMDMHRMEALGRLASGIAHDFRNVLTVVLAQGHYIKDQPGLNLAIIEAVGDIIDAAERGNKMTQELLAFGKGTPDSPQVLDLGKVLTELAGMLKLAAGRGITLGIQKHGEISSVFIDPSQFERAILNLVLNSRDAIKGANGEISIAMRETMLPKNLDTDCAYVCVSVSDNGVGMNEETSQRLFEPFYTTKGDKGTGLGLAIVQQIIHRAGGTLCVESELGKGCAIHMYLPRIGRLE